MEKFETWKSYGNMFYNNAVDNYDDDDDDDDDDDNNNNDTEIP
jgi:hypothetical protein